MKKIAVAGILTCLSFITLAGNGPNTPMKIRDRAARPDVPGMFLIEFGINFIKDEGALDMELLGSRTVNLLYFYDIRIANSNFYFMPGVGLGLERYKFEDNVKIVRGQWNLPELVELEGEVDKSMLITNYVDLPLEIRFYTNPTDRKRSFNAGVGLKVGVLYNSHSKVKQKIGKTFKEKVHDDFGINRYRYGLTGRIGIGGFNAFFFQDMNELFEDGKADFAPKASTFTIGLSFTGF